MKTKLLTISLPTKLKSKYDVFCTLKAHNKSALIEKLIDQYINNPVALTNIKTVEGHSTVVSYSFPSNKHKEFIVFFDGYCIDKSKLITKLIIKQINTKN